MLFCDNKGAIIMALHPANKPASRHIDMRIHFCRQHVELGDVATTFTLRQTNARHGRRLHDETNSASNTRTSLPTRIRQPARCSSIPLEPIVRVLA